MPGAGGHPPRAPPLGQPLTEPTRPRSHASWHLAPGIDHLRTSRSGLGPEARPRMAHRICAQKEHHAHGQARGRRLARAWSAVLSRPPSSASAIAIATASAAPVNISQGKLATASSVEGADFNASKAVDGNNGTRWASQFADAQWIQVDLGATATIASVVLRWEAAYGKTFQVQLSDNGTTWTTVATVTNGTGGNQTIDATGTGRYVRLNLHRARHRLRLLAVGVPGVRHRRRDDAAAQPEAAAAGPAGRRHDGDAPRVPGQLHPDAHPARRPDRLPGPGGRVAQPHVHGQPLHQREHARRRRCSPAARTSCTVPQDESAYWFPTLLRGEHAGRRRSASRPSTTRPGSSTTRRSAVPAGSAVRRRQHDGDAGRVPNAPGAVEGFECGNSSFNWDIPANCPAGSPAQRPLPGAELLGRRRPRLAPTTRATWRTRSTASARPATRSRCR